jgi:serine/threonine-protein kinase
MESIWRSWLKSTAPNCRYGREVDYVKILDFGMVKGEWGDASLTQVGTFAGTPHYASPEMASGLVDQVDGRSDIYALGVVAFRLITARPLFEGESAMQVLMKHVNDEPEPPSRYAPNTPPEVDELVLDCLQKEPAKRVATADELDQRLATIERSYPWSMEQAREWWESQAPKRGDRPDVET